MTTGYMEAFNYKVSGQLRLLLISLLLSSKGAAQSQDDVIGDLTVTAELFPKTPPTVRTNGTLELNCTLTRNPSNINSSDLFFVIDSRNLRVDSPYVSISDSHTTMLRLPNVQRSSAYGHAYCCYVTRPDGLSEVLASVSFRVADAPIPPKLRSTSCMVKNWRKMRCVWEPMTQDTGIPTKQRLYYRIPVGIGDGRQLFDSLPVPSNVTDSFEWTMHMVDHPFEVYIGVENELGRVVSNLINIQTHEQVKPNPVLGLNTSQTGSTWMMVTWQNEYGTDGKHDVYYQVNYSSQWNSQLIISVMFNSSDIFVRVNLTDLTPFTQYDVSVNCIPVVGGYQSGYWSDVRTNVFETKSDVPAELPYILPGAFTETSRIAGKWSLIVYLKPIDIQLQHGMITETRVRYRSLRLGATAEYKKEPKKKKVPTATLR